MALRHEQGKLRPTRPRLKDTQKRPVQRSRNQDAGGRFTPGNSAATGKALKRVISRQLGADATDPLVARLFKETQDVFRACKRAIGSEVPQVQDTLARRARWSVLSAHYALRAIELGLETDAGQRCLDLALKLDARAERLDVTALDLAQRIPDASKPESKAPWFTTEPARPADTPAGADDSALDGDSASSADANVHEGQA